MKVLIISAFPPDPAPEANHALHLTEHLAKSGITVHVLCKKGSIAPAQENIVVHPVIEDWSWRGLPTLIKHLKSLRPDVVLLIYIGWVYDKEWMITFLPTVCKSVLPGVPCITQFENIDEYYPARSWFSRGIRYALKLWARPRNVDFMYGTLLRDSSRLIFLSSPHRNRVLNRSPGGEDKSTILPPPPIIRLSADPAEARKQTRSAIGVSDDDFLLVYWGYIYPGKGIETLLKAFRIASRRDSHLRLVLVGGMLDFPTAARLSCTDYFQMVKRLPEELGITEKVTWTGNFDWDSDIGSRYLYAGDLCVLPFDYTVTLNNSSLGAASTHGLPVISSSTDVPFAREDGLEHGRNIYLCQPQDPAMLADAILLLRDNAGFRERLRSGIIELARRWHSWDVTTQNLIDVLNAAVSSPNEGDGGRFQAAPGAIEPRTHPASSADELRAGEDRVVKAQSDNGCQHESSAAAVRPDDDIEQPLVSVVVAAYNVETYLSQCLDSLVNQTLKDIEIIVVNDASTDNTREIVEAYRARYPNVRLIDCAKNVGLASVRNLGMRHAKGRYIGFVDGDDWADPYKYELMCRRAEEEDADIVFGRNKRYLDDAKYFMHANDEHLWEALSPEFKRRVFRAVEEPRVFIIEPAVWAKLYKRSFIEAHGIEFEEGMNSVEDVIFHFIVLWKAKRVAMLDRSVSFYRLNRPGQITGRKDRRVFETITVFEETARALAAWNAPDAVWASLLSTELRFFEWLHATVHRYLRDEFFSACAKHLQKIPESGFRKFAEGARVRELAKLFYMRRNRHRAYDKVNRAPWFLLLYVTLRYKRNEIWRRSHQYYRGILPRRVASTLEAYSNRPLEPTALERDVRATHDSVRSLRVDAPPDGSAEASVEVRRIDGETFFFSDCSPSRLGLQNAVRRMARDYYLSQTAAFREGDAVIDVGAHVGVVSICLAKKYPFIKIYAIEPDPLNYDCLTRNIKLNGVDNIIPLNAAVGGHCGRVTLYADRADSAWATISPEAADSLASKAVLRTAEVECVTLEALFKEHGIHHCRLLKMTAPGAVRESLQGLMRAGCVDLLCGEVDLVDCSRVKLETASWRIARQHFWRIIDSRAAPIHDSWLHQLPAAIDYVPISSVMHDQPMSRAEDDKEMVLTRPGRL